MILQMNQGTKFWKIGPSTFNRTHTFFSTLQQPTILYETVGTFCNKNSGPRIPKINRQVEQKPGGRGRGREWATLGVHPLSWLLSSNRLEKVPFVSVPHTSSNRLLLSNQGKGCTPSVAHSLALPLGPALLNLWTVVKESALRIRSTCIPTLLGEREDVCLEHGYWSYEGWSKGLTIFFLFTWMYLYKGGSVYICHLCLSYHVIWTVLHAWLY